MMSLGAQHTVEERATRLKQDHRSGFVDGLPLTGKPGSGGVFCPLTVVIRPTTSYALEPSVVTTQGRLQQTSASWLYSNPFPDSMC